MPHRIHSDRGANFESALISELLSVAGVQKSHTTPYHPMGNRSCERMNRTLGNMIRAMPPKAKHRWPQMLKSLTFAYNCTAHETTGFAPFLLMFGRIPRLPVDITFGLVLESPEVVVYDQYVQSLRRDLREAMNPAQAVTDSDVGTDGSVMTDSEDVDGVMDPAVEDEAVDDDDAEYRTRVWVSELPSGGMDDTSQEDDGQSLGVQDVSTPTSAHLGSQPGGGSQSEY